MSLNLHFDKVNKMLIMLKEVFCYRLKISTVKVHIFIECI